MREGERSAPRLTVAGVEVSVQPDLLLTGRGRAGEVTVGAVKLYISKTHPLTQEAGEYVATAVHRYLVQHKSGEGVADYRRCSVIDVFAGKVFSAPRAQGRRWQTVEAACYEIASLWPRL